jgi:hypothetical protein
MLVASAQDAELLMASVDNAAVSAVLYCRKRLSWFGDASVAPARNSLNAEPMGATSTPHDSTIPAAVPAEVAISAFVRVSSSDVSARAAGQGSRDASCIAAAIATEIARAFHSRPIFHLPFTYNFEPAGLTPDALGAGGKPTRTRMSGPRRRRGLQGKPRSQTSRWPAASRTNRPPCAREAAI